MTWLLFCLLAAGFGAGHSASASAAAGVRTPQKQAAPPASARVPAAKRAAAAGGNQHAKHPRTDAGVRRFQTCLTSSGCNDFHNLYRRPVRAAASA